MYVYLYVQVVGFIKWTLRSWLGGAAWFGHVHCMRGDICREVLKILLVHTGGEDETWISQNIE
jgi:hypothetical protein